MPCKHTQSAAARAGCASMCRSRVLRVRISGKEGWLLLCKWKDDYRGCQIANAAEGRSMDPILTVDDGGWVSS